MKIKYVFKNGEYNKRSYLTNESLTSCAGYHAKIIDFRNKGEINFIFRLNDCNNGIIIQNKANSDAERLEMIEKLRTIANAANEFADYIESKIK